MKEETSKLSVALDFSELMNMVNLKITAEDVPLVTSVLGMDKQIQLLMFAQQDISVPKEVRLSNLAQSELTPLQQVSQTQELAHLAQKVTSVLFLQ